MSQLQNSQYIGRFAPSPTGPLHFGSLLSALASFLEARQHSGKWLVRIEDLDPPREQSGASAEILDSLLAHQLIWDGDVVFQSRRLSAYQEVLEQLQSHKSTYTCRCSRSTIQSMGGVYDGRCRRLQTRVGEPVAIRLKVDADNPHVQFEDLCQGPQKENLIEQSGDFIIVRKDGLFAYQLAVVVDDIWQQVTHVIRGNDLLSSTPKQLFLYRLLENPPPQYGHIPVLNNRLGQKLSKQHKAEPLDNKEPGRNLFLALQLLCQNPPVELKSSGTGPILAWAIEHWDIQRLPKQGSLSNTLG